MGRPVDRQTVLLASSATLNLDSIEAVGSYAIQLFWNDGHHTGIYSWDTLRAACTCVVCLEDANSEL